MTTTSETLNRAADLIEERGWTQGPRGMSIGTDTPLCLEGAIGAAVGITKYERYNGEDVYSYDETQSCPAGQAVRAYLDVLRPWSWNDHYNRTATEVIEVLRATAVIEAARENAETRTEVSV
jgi:hypothetical protein